MNRDFVSKKRQKTLNIKKEHLTILTINTPTVYELLSYDKMYPRHHLE